MMLGMDPYIQRILGLLGKRDPIEVLTQTPKDLQELYYSLNFRTQLTYEMGKWNALQIMCHLCDAELGYSFRLRQVLNGQGIQAFDQDAWIGLHQGHTLGQSLQLFTSLRGWNLDFFRSLSPEQLATTALHPERGPESIKLMLKFLAGHDLNHLAQLDKIATLPRQVPQKTPLFGPKPAASAPAAPAKTAVKKKK
jgi:hypothetical protein